MLNQLHVVQSNDVSGESVAALNYSQAASGESCKVILVSQGTFMKIDKQSSVNLMFAQQFTLKHKNFFLNMFFEYKQISKLCELHNFNLIHLHGMWSSFLAIAAFIANKRDITLLISPHGNLEPWALRYKYYKKFLAMKIYQGAILRSASLFVVNSEQESYNLQKLGFQQPIAVIPNGVNVDILVPNMLQTKFKTFLFMSRIHPVKGLLDLVEAWSLVKRSGWRVIVAGPDVGGHQSKVEDLIRKKGLENDFEFRGFVNGAQKKLCFDQADIFILPSYSENFGIVIAEALANELPVITTTATPWPDLVKQKCGWWVKPGISGISSAMHDAMSLEPESLKQMGYRGRQLVITNYSWKKIGTTIKAVNEWVLNKNKSKPEVVNLHEN
jgi:glycosyltransferase involved in cell wall biosynthesis